MEGMYDTEIKYVGYKTGTPEGPRREWESGHSESGDGDGCARTVGCGCCGEKRTGKMRIWLSLEQQKAVIAVQSVSVKELSRKGVSMRKESCDAKVTGISKQDGVEERIRTDWVTAIIPTTFNGFPLVP